MAYIYSFDAVNQQDVALLGGKGANLAEMKRLDLPVPSGFTITTAACQHFLKQPEETLAFLENELLKAISNLEDDVQRQFGNRHRPLLVSVRSGAPISMPGMMDTILNLGLNDETVIGLARQTNDERFAYDCYRRLVQMFGDVVFGISKSLFEGCLTKLKQARGIQNDSDLTVTDLKTLLKLYQQLYHEHGQVVFPQNVTEQLHLAIQAVFKSWLNPRAKTYRRLHQIDNYVGTAVNIQQMVFGNYRGQSGTGVAFTRNPATGTRALFGEYLLNAQGEDVVAGVRTPQDIQLLQAQLPAIYRQFEQIAERLEKHYQEMQDMEFTIEDGTLYLLQTRSGKRTPQAAFKIAVDLVREGTISRGEALQRLNPSMIAGLLHAGFDNQASRQAPLLVTGLPASPGAVSGAICFSATQAQQVAATGTKVILVRQETSPEDIEGMLVSEAVVTSRGGMTSHAAVVARGMGVCCVVGCDGLVVDDTQQTATFNGRRLEAGTVISVDGETGRVYLGEVSQRTRGEQQDLKTVLQWCQQIATLKVWANAETRAEVQTALDFGAEGIGLVRTEHMFFGKARILLMRELILADTQETRLRLLKQLKVFQVDDFTAILRLSGDLPCTIRLLDPPLHEFLPQNETEQVALAQALHISLAEVKKRIAEKAEVNPMMGHRGCRLAISYPEIYEMQVAAIVESVRLVQRETHVEIHPKIMLPLIGTATELSVIKQRLQRVIQAQLVGTAEVVHCQIGTMIEVPRACLIADQLAQQADFFSFGTNDLTQLTYGYSRDDSSHFLTTYQQEGVLKKDPFQVLDQAGVGELIQLAIQRGRTVQPQLSIGVCGEIGGDPESVKFLSQLKVSYVSCSPYRVPAAWLAAAQATLATKVGVK